MSFQSDVEEIPIASLVLNQPVDAVHELTQ